MRRSMDGFALIFLLSFLLSSIISSTSVHTIRPGQPIRDGDTIISAEQTFELGFFSPGSSERRYVGIWYKKVSTGTVVWVANRETPVFDRSGVLSITDKGFLVLQNSTRDSVWSSNATSMAKIPVAQLLESGNLVVRNGNDSSENYLWQSFDYPSDTFLPGMKLGKDFVSGLERILTSWKSLDDPARGEYSCSIDPHGYPQLIFRKGNAIEDRVGSWNGIRFTGVPRQTQNAVYRYEFVLNEREVYYYVKLLNKSVLSRLVVNASGTSMRLTWIDQQHGWARFFTVGEDQCDNYAKCGANAKCNINDAPMCSCLEGFEPKSLRDWSFLDWSGGCVRKNPLVCSKGEGFVNHFKVKLPDTSNSWFDKSMSLKECEELCLKNCSCTAYANMDIRDGGSGCLHWFSDLIDMREFSETGQDIYIRMAASYLDNIRRGRWFDKSKQIGIAVFSVIAAIGVLILGWFLYVRKRRLKNREKKNIFRRDYSSHDANQDLELPIIDLSTIFEATKNFSSSNKLGEGGFGPVYKGTTMDGQEIAVKRLSMNSRQGLEEFKNEVLLIAKLQHRNLVKLLGCCIEGNERMLIYEYMPNKSLDNFIFDQRNSKLLDWPKRKNIISGIARGLLYLHQDSRLRIIHRDLKASNVLLDNNMNPKISDFGMARSFGADQTEENTKKVVGTYGYMSPEYAVEGLFSTKSDVFSFGVLVLEIVSGKKNRGFNHPGHHHNLLGHAWRLWNEGRPLEIINELLGESSALSQILRCIHIGLLCVQQGPEDRPSMSSVVVMLDSEIPLPQPKQPGFFTERSLFDPDAESSSSKQKSTSTYDITISLLEPR